MLEVLFIQLIGNSVERYQGFFFFFKKEIWKRLAPLASRAAGTHDYVPVCSMGSTSVLKLKLNLKDVSTDNAHNLHSKTPWIQSCKLHQKYIFRVKYILSQNPSITAWTYGAAMCSEISFQKYISVMIMFLKCWLKYWNCSSPFYYSCIIILKIVYMSWIFLCGLINQDRWLDGN